VLVNNAGIRASAPFLTLSPKAFDLVLATNLRAPFLCTQEAARLMVKHKKRGAIINIASTRAFMSEANTEAYSASKGGIAALTHATAISLGARGIRVNAISPGWIETRGRKHSRRDKLQHPVGRVGTPEDVASACLYIAEQAGFMTGQNLTLDGGMSVNMIYED
jgi:NAD(P)-dependent dehydrogenase (short-subunit alcohol dehydrogenase family)